MSEILDLLMDDPSAYVTVSFDSLYRMAPEEVAELQLHWVRKRFEALRPRIGVLDKLAEAQGVDTVNHIDDIAPVLFAHTVYKSYPMAALERNRFDMLTRWISGLTTTDLSAVDPTGIESIDDWIIELDNKSDLMVFHSSGTTGKLSFVPRSKGQGRIMAMNTGLMLRDWHGPNSRNDMFVNHYALINPGYEFGAATAQRTLGYALEMYAGGIDNALILNKGQRFSADMQSLAGRIRNAEAKGELGMLQIPPALLKRREELMEAEKLRPQRIAQFMEEAIEKFGGRNIFIGGTYPMLYQWAKDGLATGRRKVFAPDSFVAGGGGMKGTVMPADFKEQIMDFLGVDEFFDTYQMTEGIPTAPRCREGKYHISPLMVVYLLDPQTGKVLPGKDGTTGRMAFFDIIPDSYWAGFVSGDEVTMSGWERPCKCGRTGLYAEPDIRRYSEKEGGDDKLMCSGAPEAHDKAAAFLADYAG